jgi:sn-glycerol 3-phosphate transport system substrate-binding protein
MNWMRWWGIGPALALVVTACGGGTSDPAAEDAAEDNADSDECSAEALEEAAADGPVEITFWHVATGENEEVLGGLIEDFHDEQDLVRVRLVSNNSYGDQEEKYRAEMGSDRAPDLVQHQEVYLQEMVDTQTALPVQACIDAEDYDLSDFIPRTVNYYEVEDVQWALPFNVNTPVLIYNRAVFEEADLDPDNPPQTLAELSETAEALMDANPGDLTAGMGLKRDGWLLEEFLALQGVPLVDNGNGRDGRATEVLADSEAGVDIFTTLNDLVESGLAETNPTEGDSRFDNLIGVGSGSYGMTFDSSGTLGEAQALLDEEQYPGIEPGVAPMPGLTEDGGALIGGGSLYISSTGGPAEKAAAWELTKFLTSPEAQSIWAAGTGFIPVRESAVELPEIQDRWESEPYFRVAYDQLLDGAENEATAGPVMGKYRAYRDAAEEVSRQMFGGDLTPEAAVSTLSDQANDLLTEYNEDVTIGVEDD